MQTPIRPGETETKGYSSRMPHTQMNRTERGGTVGDIDNLICCKIDSNAAQLENGLVAYSRVQVPTRTLASESVSSLQRHTVVERFLNMVTIFQ